MAHLNSNEKQISTMALKPLLTDQNNTRFNETGDKMNGFVDHENNLHSNHNTGINIKFQDIVYRVRRHVPWDRCKFNHIDSTQFCSFLKSILFTY